VRRDIYSVKKPGERRTAARPRSSWGDHRGDEVLDHHGDIIGQATPAAPVTAFKITTPDKITLSFAR
jgi:hypothetical protein